MINPSVLKMIVSIYIYIYMGKNYNDLTVLPKPGIMVNKGNHPQMTEQFRLVKYYYLPRYTYNVGPPRLLSWL